MKNRIALHLLLLIMTVSCDREQSESATDNMMVRVAELEIKLDQLEAYKTILIEEAEASVRLEPGVISIFPMFESENPTHIRILEIYANEEAYKSHLETAHFKHYKTTTENMVVSLKLSDMNAMDTQTMSKIFKRLDQ